MWPGCWQLKQVTAGLGVLPLRTGAEVFSVRKGSVTGVTDRRGGAAVGGTGREGAAERELA